MFGEKILSLAFSKGIKMNTHFRPRSTISHRECKIHIFTRVLLELITSLVPQYIGGSSLYRVNPEVSRRIPQQKNRRKEKLGYHQIRTIFLAAYCG
jgi:hypothetical protein